MTWIEGGGFLHAKDIGWAHSKVHEGGFWIVPYYAGSKDNATSVDVVITTGARAVHVAFSIDVGGSSNWAWYEAPTGVTGGTAISPKANNRQNVKVPNLTAVHSPTVGGVGVLLDEGFTPGGGGPFANGGSDRGPARAGTEWILAPNTSYLLRVTNISGSAVFMGVGFGFYER